MTRIRIDKTVEVDDEAAAGLMADFLEWMEALGIRIDSDAANSKMGSADWTWAELAESYVAERNSD